VCSSPTPKLNKVDKRRQHSAVRNGRMQFGIETRQAMGVAEMVEMDLATKGFDSGEGLVAPFFFLLGFMVCRWSGRLEFGKPLFLSLEHQALARAFN